MSTTWYDSHIIHIEDLSPTTRSFTVEIESTEIFDFLPGQFIIVDLPLGTKRINRWRSYSIANAPNGSNQIELCIVKMEGGLATSYFFDEVKIGTSIRFKGPSGTFTLPKKLDRTNVFISTGTGVAPFRSMMQHIELNKIKHELIHVMFGTRFKSGLLYFDEFNKWAQLKNISYSVALSRELEMPESSEDIEFVKGYVHSIYNASYKELGMNSHFYLCGWTPMIDEAIANLIIRMGYPKEQIHYELYG